MTPSDLLELRDDLLREEQRLQKLVQVFRRWTPVCPMDPKWSKPQRYGCFFYTGVERFLLLVSRLVNGSPPVLGEGWHRRLLERMA